MSQPFVVHLINPRTYARVIDFFCKNGGISKEGLSALFQECGKSFDAFEENYEYEADYLHGDEPIRALYLNNALLELVPEQRAQFLPAFVRSLCIAASILPPLSPLRPFELWGHFDFEPPPPCQLDAGEGGFQGGWREGRIRDFQMAMSAFPDQAGWREYRPRSLSVPFRLLGGVGKARNAASALAIDENWEQWTELRALVGLAAERNWYLGVEA